MDLTDKSSIHTFPRKLSKQKLYLNKRKTSKENIQLQRKLLMVELTRCLGYFKRENAVFNRVSSCCSHFSDECNRLKTAFWRLKDHKHPVNSTIKSFVDSKVCDQQRPLSPAKDTDDTVRVVLPFKDQISADIVKEQLISRI